MESGGIRNGVAFSLEVEARGIDFWAHFTFPDEILTWLMKHVTLAPTEVQVIFQYFQNYPSVPSIQPNT
jgi:hypothetical protein